MNTEPIISIIVPIYNAQKYLSPCLKSIIEQTYTNIEIILIDDGSVDESGEICDVFARNDGRIKVIHSENRGVSAARNVGLEISLGEFITFVDSDDTVEKDFIKELYETFEDGVDMTVCAFNDCDKDGSIKTVCKATQNGITLNQEDAIKEMLLGRIFAGHCWNKMFKKNILGELRFRDDIAIYEDLLFVGEYLLRSNNVKTCNRPLYNYFERADSALHKKMSQSRLSALSALDTISFALNKNYGEKFNKLIAYGKERWAIDCYSLLCYDKENRAKYEPILRKVLKENKCNEFILKDMKIKRFLIRVNPKLFYLIKKVLKN